VMRSSTLYRRLRLEGQIQAEIEWDARGAIEHVNVNGRKVVGQMAFFSSIPHFEFDMYAGGRKFHVTIDLRTFLVYITTAFRLAIDGQVVYAEGRWAPDQNQKIKVLHSTYNIG